MAKGSRRVSGVSCEVELIAGLDLGDRSSRLCVLDRESGAVKEESRVVTSPAGMKRRFGGCARMRIAIEVGTHSPWVSRLLSECGHEVIVANPRKVRLIYENRRKDDRVDAEYLARLARTDPKLLAPIRHRGAQAQRDLAMLRARDSLVRSRTQLVNHVRGAIKACGHRMPRCDAEGFAGKAEATLPAELKSALTPLIEVIAGLTAQIRGYERQLETLAATSYPETALLRQVRGVGLLTSLAYVLTIEDPARFRTSRAVGAYLGLVPAHRISGQSNPHLRISKEGDSFLRRLLVGSAHYILGPFGEDCDLRRCGERLGARGSRKERNRAVVAVARKLAVLLHRLWSSKETYDTLYNARRASELRPAA